MKKRFWQPIWKFEEIETKLALLEQEGYRLDKIHGFRCFEFVESKPKTSQYFFTYYIAREAINMVSIENTLQKKLNANKIKGDFNFLSSGVSVFRITSIFDAKEQVINRNICLQHFVFKKMMIGLICLLLLLIPIAIGVLLNFSKFINDINIVYGIFFACWIVASLWYTIHNLIGFVYLKRKYNTLYKNSKS